MLIFLKIAWRNVARNKYRSCLTISAIAIGLASLIFIRAFVAGSHYQMIENYTDLSSGHIQIHASGFQTNMSLAKGIPQPEKIITLLQKNPAVRASAQRIKEYVLLSTAENSVGVLLIGVEPEKEVNITRLHTRIRQGGFISGNEDIVIGKELAKSLSVGLNDKIIVVAQAFDGSLASAAYRVKGLLDTGAEELDKGIALISLKAAQDLFVLGKRVSEIAIRTNSVENAAKTAQQLRAHLDASVFEVLEWQKISPIIVQWVEFDIAFINIILMIVLLVVAAGIINTLLMGILERTREFGIMLALGTRRAQIMLMVCLESLILGIAGTAIGYIAGGVFSVYFGKKGIDLSMFSTALNNYYTGSIIYTRLNWNYLIEYGIVVLLTSIIVSVYPAWRAANLKPVEAIRH